MLEIFKNEIYINILQLYSNNIYKSFRNKIQNSALNINN